MTITKEDLESLLTKAEATKSELRAMRKDAFLNPRYKRFQGYMKTFWRMQAQDFMKEFAGFKNLFTEAPSPRQILRSWEKSIERATTRMVRDARKEFLQAIKDGAGSTLVDIPHAGNYGVGFSASDPRIKALIDSRIEFMTNSVNATSQQRIASLVQRMTDEGASYTKMSKAIRAEIKGWYTPTGAAMTRAELISITEVGEMYEGGRRMVTDDLTRAGAKLEKLWINVEDNRVCPVCESAVLDGWIPMQAYFSNGFAHPLAHGGCRCDIEIYDATPGGARSDSTGGGFQEFSSGKDARSWINKNWKTQPKSHGNYPNAIRDTMEEYVTDTFYDINKGLRFDNKKLLNFHADDILNMDEAVALGTPLPDDVVMWRGLMYKPPDLLKGITDPTKVIGKIFTDKGFGSMSLNPGIADEFAFSGYKFKIMIPKGKKMITGFWDQVEYIMPRGTRYRVAAVEKVEADVLFSTGKRKWLWQITLEVL